MRKAKIKAYVKGEQNNGNTKTHLVDWKKQTRKRAYLKHSIYLNFKTKVHPLKKPCELAWNVMSDIRCDYLIQQTSCSSTCSFSPSGVCAEVLLLHQRAKLIMHIPFLCLKQGDITGVYPCGLIQAWAWGMSSFFLFFLNFFLFFIF